MAYSPDYRVTKEGKVYGVSGTLLKPYITPQGYATVTVKVRGKRVKKTVHRLVAERYLDNTHNLPCINHKDGNKLNNAAENLEWCSYSDNMKHAFASGIRKPTGTKRVWCSNDMIYCSVAEASRKTGINKASIAQCCRGLIKTAGGLKWGYWDEL